VKEEAEAISASFFIPLSRDDEQPAPNRGLFIFRIMVDERFPRRRARFTAGIIRKTGMGR
jgi:hypothetical protein